MAILITTFVVVILMCSAFATVFFMVLQGGEEVMVPQVEGMPLVDALVEMQEKELYPRILLRYSDSPADMGRVLEQEPKAGSVVKAGRRISLAVSRGSATEQVDNFTGQNIDNVRAALQTFSSPGDAAILSIMEPVLYRESAEPEGTILEQNPAPGTLITEPVQISFVVSSGLDYSMATVPSITGKSIAELVSIMEESEFTFNFTARSPENGEAAGTVVSQFPRARTRAEKFSAVDAVIAMPPASPGGPVYGIFMEELPQYPYPFQVTVDIMPPSGGRRKYLSMQHPGGLLSVPYALDEGSLISLTVLDREYGIYEIEPAIPALPEYEEPLAAEEQEEERGITEFDDYYFYSFDEFDSIF